MFALLFAGISLTESSGATSAAQRPDQAARAVIGRTLGYVPKNLVLEVTAAIPPAVITSRPRRRRDV